MKVAIITDTHFGAKSDATMMLDFQEQFFDTVFFPTLVKEKVQHVIHLGDLVDRRKYINFNTAARMRNMFLTPLHELGVPCDFVIGNHDTTFKNINDINCFRELVTDRYPKFRVFEQPTHVNLDGLEILYVPWIAIDNKERDHKFIKASKAPVCMGHLEINGFMNNDKLPIEQGEPPEMFDKFDLVYSGHIHHQMNHDNIRYLGSPYEMTWADYGEVKGFHLFDTKTRKLTFIENPLKLHIRLTYNDGLYTVDKMISKIPDIENKIVKVFVEEKNDPYTFDKYYEVLQGGKTYDLKIIDQSTIIENLDEVADDVASGDTLTYMLGCVDKVDVPCDKARLKYYLSKLYNTVNVKDLV